LRHRAIGVTRHDLEARHNVAAFQSLTHIAVRDVRGASAKSSVFETHVVTVVRRSQYGNDAGLPYFERRRGIA
jgi:hypothetical protein